MPVYCYKCKECDSEFEVRHSMSYESQTCTFCGSINVFRIPKEINTKPLSSTSLRTPGKIVDKYIEETKETIKNEKDNLKKRKF